MPSGPCGYIYKTNFKINSFNSFSLHYQHPHADCNCLLLKFLTKLLGKAIPNNAAIISVTRFPGSIRPLVWSPIRSVRQEVLLSINHKNYNFREKETWGAIHVAKISGPISRDNVPANGSRRTGLVPFPSRDKNFALIFKILVKLIL